MFIGSLSLRQNLGLVPVSITNLTNLTNPELIFQRCLV